MESQKTQSFAKGSCFYQFFSLTIRVVEGYFLVQVLMEGCERRRSGSLALRLSRLSLYYEQSLFGGWRPTYSFHPAYAVGTQGDRTPRCPLWSLGAQRAWSVRARAASWSRNTQTV